MKYAWKCVVKAPKETVKEGITDVMCCRAPPPHQLSTALLHAVSQEVWFCKIKDKIKSLRESDKKIKNRIRAINHPDKVAEGQRGNQQCCLLTYRGGTE